MSSHPVKADHETTTEAVEKPHVEETIQRLVEGIDIQSPISIISFGEEVAERTASYADELLVTTRINGMDKVGNELTRIVTTVKSFAHDAEDTDRSVLGAVTRRMKRTEVKAQARFDSVKNQIDGLVEDVERTVDLLRERGATYEAMYVGVRTEHASLSEHIAALDIRLDELESELADTSIDESDLDQVEKRAAQIAAREALSKRGGDLRTLQHSALQTLPMIRVVQGNNIALIDKFQTIQKLTLPAWKRTFLMASTLSEQKKTVDLANTIDDATNDFMKRNADLLHANSVSTAKANQRAVVDLETLRHVHDKVLQTLEDVQTVHAQGDERREALVHELEVLRSEMRLGGKTSDELNAEENAGTPIAAH